VRRPPSTELLLILACAAGSALLAASQFTNLFELAPPGGETLRTIDAADQHGYATLVLAVLSLVLLVVSMAARSEGLVQGARFAVAVCGIVALLIFLLIDLPDAGSLGALNDESFVDAKAEPAAGFWFALAGSLVLTVCGGALAAMGPGGVPGSEPDPEQRRPSQSAPPPGGASGGPRELRERGSPGANS
jgi:hypothetical protein